MKSSLQDWLQVYFSHLCAIPYSSSSTTPAHTCTVCFGLIAHLLVYNLVSHCMSLQSNWYCCGFEAKHVFRFYCLRRLNLLLFGVRQSWMRVHSTIKNGIYARLNSTNLKNPGEFELLCKDLQHKTKLYPWRWPIRPQHTGWFTKFYPSLWYIFLGLFPANINL
jgi:hypothetical protein